MSISTEGTLWLGAGIGTMMLFWRAHFLCDMWCRIDVVSRNLENEQLS
jgi:hypothetical protein